MKNIFAKALGVAAVAAMTMTSCGDSFLDTDIYDAVDMDGALDNANRVELALNGTYYRFSQYYFAGNYATVTPDLASDITYWNGSNSHQNAMYQFNYLDTEYSMLYIWAYGYKVVDNSARIIQACDELIPSAGEADKATLIRAKAEAHALRAYAMSVMTNVFGHQVKVNGQDYSSTPGVVIVDTPVEPGSTVSRSTVGDCYAQMLSDLDKALAGFNEVGDRRSMFAFGKASTLGLMARVKLMLEDFDGAAQAASDALAAKGIAALTYDPEAYEALYAGNSTNTESFLALALDEKTNWSANSCGTLFTTYCYGPSPYLVSLMGDNDIRTAIWYWTDQKRSKIVPYGDTKPWFGGGKFGVPASGNCAEATNYLINAPEMFLIEAESKLRSASNKDLDGARRALLVVAKRNLDITSTADLPADEAGLMSFIRDERARELFQEGHRLWDLRRWNVVTNLTAYQAPEVKWRIENVTLGDLLLPIPVDEINAGFGVTQNEGWAATRPQ